MDVILHITDFEFNQKFAASYLRMDKDNETTNNGIIFSCAFNNL